MTLYLKYRPKNLDEIDSKEVSESLKKIVKSGKIPHAFLFAGPKGTGKTSAARILAKIINCEHLSKDKTPCDKCEQCTAITKGSNLDVIEMDAASHRGIDDVRSLRDAVKLSPSKAKKKIYIIDEAHMLTTEASNALLKTLEEPPEHVVFILATTNPEKLIDTIRSRTTYIPFRKGTTEEIVRSLGRVAKGEKIKINKEALESIAAASDGIFRDATKILEQLVAEDKPLTKDFLDEYLFRQKSFDTDRFIGFLVARNIKAAIEEVAKLGPSGVPIELFLDALLAKLRAALLAKVGVTGSPIEGLEEQDLVRLIELFVEASRNIGVSSIEELPVEIAIIKWGEGATGQSVRSEINSTADQGGTSRDSSRSKTSAGRVLSQTGISIAHESPAITQEIDVSVQASVLDEEIKGTVNDEAWRMILSMIKPVNASIEALLRAARPVSYDGKTLTLGVFYRFHKERLEDAQHRRILEEIVAEVLKSPTKVICILVEPPPKKVIEEAKVEPVLTEGKDEDIIKVAEEIFSN